MNRIIPFKSVNTHHDEACAWLVKLDSESGPAIHEEFLLWLEADQKNAEAFARVASLWDQMDVLDALSEIFPLESYTTIRKHPTRGRRLLFAAVGIVCAIFIGVYFEIVSGYQTKTYITAIGGRETVALPDGSEVILNTNSVMRVSYSMNERSVYLERGEGHFTVAKNRGRPFRVYVGNRIVEAVGTAFSVQRGGGSAIEVIVTEGLVNLKSIPDVIQTASGNPVPPLESIVQAVAAGEYAAVSDESTNEEVKKIAMEQSEIDAKLAWRDGMLLFQGEPLDFVVREVSRYTETTIQADEAIKDVAVHGYFRAGDITGLLVTMRENFKVNSKNDGNGHILLTRDDGVEENYKQPDHN